MRIVVRGLPAPQGNHRVSPAGGLYESGKAVGPWREAVRAETQKVAAPSGGFQGDPVVVEITFRLPRPKSLPKRIVYPAKRPDVDKLARAVLDGIVEGGALADDSQVVALVASKLFATDGYPPGCVIYIVHPDDEELEGDQG